MAKEDFIIKMHSLILSRASITIFVEAASEEIGNPILVTDCELRCIAKSDDDIDDPIWTLMSNWSPTSSELPLYDKINKERLSERMQSAIKPVINAFEFSEHRMMDCVVRWRGAIFGLIHAFEINKPFADSDMAILSELARSLAFVMTSEQAVDSRSLSLEEIALRYLLNGTSVTQGLFKGKLFTLDRLNRYTVIVAENAQESNRGFFPSTTKEALSSIFPLSQALVYENQLVILAQIPIRGGFFAWDWASFRKLLQTQNLRGAVSDPFIDFHSIRRFYRQSLKALQIGQRFTPTEPLFMYEDVGLYEMLDSVQQPFLESGTRYPPLLALLEHDDKHGTTYFKDLFVYLQNNCSTRKTADALSVHKNTINYRIGRIASIMGRDLSDNAFLFRLSLSVKILYYQEASNFSERYHIPEEFIRWPVI